MPLTIDDLCSRLAQASLLSTDESRSVLDSLAASQRPTDGESFAGLLVSTGKLTAFQAKRVCEGKAHTLVLGNYVLLDQLGQGGMGAVFKAQHRRMKRLVAIKVVRPELLDSPAAIKRFQREVETVAKLDHPNIVIAHDADEANSINYLVMQYVDGRDLHGLLKKDGPFPVAKAVECVLQAARGLAYAHRQGIIHRDIKPSNLLLDANGTVKILDLGLATLVTREPSGGDSLTGTEMFVGTPDYIAPEQAKSPKLRDPRSDIYSLGITLYVLLTGRPAYEGESVVEKILAHREQPIPSLRDSALHRAISAAALDDLHDIFHRMAAKQPSDRYQTMDEVAGALESLQRRHHDSLALAKLGAAEGTVEWTRSNVPSGGGDRAPAPDLAPRATLGAAGSAQAVKAMEVGYETGSQSPTASMLLASEDTTTNRKQPASLMAAAEPSQSIARAFKRWIASPRSWIALATTAIVLGVAGVLVVTQRPGPRPLVVATVDNRTPGPSSRDLQEQPPNEIPLSPFTSGPALPVPVQLRVAEMVLKHGGNLKIRSLGRAQIYQIAMPEEIPTEPFVISEIELINRKEITARDIGVLGELPYLMILNLEGTGVGDEAIEAILQIDGLTLLNLGSTKITDAGARRLASMTSLIALHLPGTSVSDNVMKEVKKLPRLRSLILPASITDAGLKELSDHRTIQLLHLGGNPGVTEVGVASLQAMPSLQALALGSTPIGDEVVDVLTQFPRLRFIGLRNSKVTSAGALRLQAAAPNAIVVHSAVPIEREMRAAQWVRDHKGTVNLPSGTLIFNTIAFPTTGVGASGGAENLVGLRSLNSLIWYFLTNADREIESIATLDSLTYLVLEKSDLTDTGLNRLSELPQLEHLSINNCKRLTNVGMSHLTAFAHLSSLWAQGLQITDQGLEAVGKATNLYTLQLSECGNITSNGLNHLAALSNLRSLRLEQTKIDDAAVVHLRKMTSLRVLHLEETNVSPAAVATLSQALPKCAIFYTGGAIVPGWTNSAPGAAAGLPSSAPPRAIAPFNAEQAKAHQEAWAKHLGLPVEQTNSIGMKLRLVPPGEFLMGSTAEDVEALVKQVAEDLIPPRTVGHEAQIRSEAPQHLVRINKPFVMGVTEVTVGQFRQFVESTKYETETARLGGGRMRRQDGYDPARMWSAPGYPVSDDTPVTQVTWNDGVAFCNWLSRQSSLEPAYRLDARQGWMLVAGSEGYRLPTEAEWEYACRAGTDTRFSFGSDESLAGNFVWHLDPSGQPRAVGLKPGNAFGLRDLHGNVHEWCHDRWSAQWYAQSPVDDPTGPTSGSSRVTRGGDITDKPVICRSAFRTGWPQNGRGSTLGFRVVRAALTTYSSHAGAAVAPNAGTSRTGFALEFNGKDSYVALAPFPYDGSHPVTIEAWVRERKSPNPEETSTAVGFKMGLQLSNGLWRSASRNTSSVAVAVSDPKQTSQKSVLLSAVWDGKTMHLFMDGVRVGSAALDGFNTKSESSWLVIGAAGSSSGNIQFYDGVIDEVRLSKVARYTADFTPPSRFEPDSDTLALYHFDEGQGEVLIDSSGNNHHGKIVNAKWVPGIAGGPAPMKSAP